jgi:hypothetical protein
MTKKVISAILALTMLFMTACGQADSSDDIKETTSITTVEQTQTEDTSSDSEPAGTTEETTTTTASETSEKEETTSSQTDHTEDNDTVDAASELVLIKLAKEMYSAEDLTGDEKFKSTFKSKLKSSQDVSVCAEVKTSSFFDPFNDLICDNTDEYASIVPEAQVFYLSNQTKTGEYSGEIIADAFACNNADSADKLLDLLKGDHSDSMRKRTAAGESPDKVENVKTETETGSYIYSCTQAKMNIYFGYYALGKNVYCLCLIYPSDLPNDKKPDADIKEAFEKLCKKLGVKSPAQLQ